MNWFKKRPPRPQPKTEWTEPPLTLIDELNRGAFSQAIWRHCARAHESALEARTEPVVLVSSDVWRAITLDAELRLDMRWALPSEQLRPTEVCVLYGVHICVDEPESYPLYDGLMHNAAEAMDRLPISKQAYDPGWAVWQGLDGTKRYYPRMEVSDQRVLDQRGDERG